MASGLDLGKQVGPLPLGGWIAVVVGGLGIGYFVSKGQANADGGEQLVPQTERGVGEGGGQFIYDPPQTGTPETEPETNDSWGIKVTKWLIGRGNDPTVSDQAVRKYLSGMDLSIQEDALLGTALIRFGPPPEPITPVDNMPDPGSGGGEDTGELRAPKFLHLNATGRTVRAQWENVPGADKYEVRMAGFTGRFSGRKQVVSGTNATFTNVPGNTRHSFVVYPLKGNDPRYGWPFGIHTTNSIAVGG